VQHGAGPSHAECPMLTHGGTFTKGTHSLAVHPHWGYLPYPSQAQLQTKSIISCLSRSQAQRKDKSAGTLRITANKPSLLFHSHPCTPLVASVALPFVGSDALFLAQLALLLSRLWLTWERLQNNMQRFVVKEDWYRPARGQWQGEHMCTMGYGCISSAEWQAHNHVARPVLASCTPHIILLCHAPVALSLTLPPLHHLCPECHHKLYKHACL